jgi:hypothetical protein
MRSLSFGALGPDMRLVASTSFGVPFLAAAFVSFDFTRLS